MMWQELEEEYKRFVKEIESGNLVLGEYFDEMMYEDEYPHNMIDEYKSILIEKIKEYLHEHYPTKFVVTGGSCVYVLTVEEAKRRDLFNLESRIVN